MSVETRAEEIPARTAVEVAWGDFRGETVIERGRFYTLRGDALTIEIGGVMRQRRADTIRYVSPISEKAHCASFREGDRVYITKYGGQYRATVTGVFKTRLAVTFTTRGGKTKSLRLPAIDCERIAPGR